MAKYSALAQGLGVFSIALGAAEVFTPGPLASAIGTGENDFIFRTAGMRELAAGVGILSQPYPLGWLWGRVAGDAMDLAMLGVALSNPRHARERVAGALAMVLGVTVLDVFCALDMSRQPRASEVDAQHESRVVRTVTVMRPAEELYAFWSDPQNLPRFMQFLDSVEPAGERQAKWSYNGPRHMRVTLDVEMTERTQGRAIAWRASARGKMQTSARVTFAPATGGRGTVVRYEMELPKAPLGMQRFLGQIPGELAAQNLRRFKQLMEVGEILTNEGQPSGRRKSERAAPGASRRGEISSTEQQRADDEALRVRGFAGERQSGV